MQHYLFVHFKEKRTPDGEQVYFGVSRDGFHWEAINNGQPVLWAMLNEKGVRDMAIVRADNGKFYIFATDLSLSYMFREHYKGQWGNIQRYGSNCLMMWESEDLLHWSKEQAVPVKKPGTGCCWAPDITRDSQNGGYILHWSSPIPEK
ncbi:MAG: 1,4-beta-xylanase, partial [Firmicutes bacterium]|nr:1,4-beta-xylanase [Bacillota bacterium]